MSNAKTGQLAETLATWIYLLDEAGHPADDERLVHACNALRSADPDADLDALGQALVGAVDSALDGARDFDTVVEKLVGLYGADHVATDLGNTREERVKNIRGYEFRTHLPWLAQVIDRFPNGEVGPHWVMVERVTDVVTCMDPYPWDDLDEEYRQPLIEFLVKWELAGCRSLRWVVDGTAE